MKLIKFITYAIIMHAAIVSCGVSNVDTIEVEVEPIVAVETIEEIIEIDSLSLLPTSEDDWVVDTEELFTPEEEEQLSKKMKDFAGLTTNEIGIVTVSEYTPYSNIDNFSLSLFNKWGIGTAEKNNGILITISKQQQNVRISTGTGLEEVLTDEEVKTINDEIVIPFFKNGNYYGGANAAVDAVINEL